MSEVERLKSGKVDTAAGSPKRQVWTALRARKRGHCPVILLLGASGYLGQAFAATLRQRRRPFIPLTRRLINYSDFNVLFDYVRKMQPEFVINAAGCGPDSDDTACGIPRQEVLWANAVLPQTIAKVCLMTNTPWGHVSSALIYTGAKVAGDWGRLHVERNLNLPKIRRLFEEHPEKLHGFTEWDAPNCSFRQAPCSFYSGTKALAEEAIHNYGQCYLWRPGVLFDHLDEPRNLLSRILQRPRLPDGIHSLSHRESFVQACLDLWDRQAPYGIYNMVNPGAITTRHMADLIGQMLEPVHEFEFWEDDEAVCGTEVNRLRCNCVLDTSKLMSTGVTLRSVEEALIYALRKWQPAPRLSKAAQSDMRPAIFSSPLATF